MDRFYIVDRDPGELAGRCVLTGERAVICSCLDERDAIALVEGRENLEVVRRSELTEENQKRVLEAFSP